MLNKELANKIKREAVYMLIAFIAAGIILKIAFYKEGFTAIARMAAGIFWIFVLPGFYLLYYWHDKLEFIERLIVGLAVSIGVIGILSYYIGIIGVDIKYHTVIIPLILFAAGGLGILKKLKKD